MSFVLLNQCKICMSTYVNAFLEFRNLKLGSGEKWEAKEEVAVLQCGTFNHDSKRFLTQHWFSKKGFCSPDPKAA